MTSHDRLEAIKYICYAVAIVGGLWALAWSERHK